MLRRNTQNVIHLQGLRDLGDLDEQGNPLPVEDATAAAKVVADDGTLIAENITLQPGVNGFPANDYVGFWNSADALDDYEEVEVVIVATFEGSPREFRSTHQVVG